MQWKCVAACIYTQYEPPLAYRNHPHGKKTKNESKKLKKRNIAKTEITAKACFPCLWRLMTT
jgi:hypothetical protein